MYSQIEANKRKTAVIMLLFFALVGGLAFVFSKAYGTPSIFVGAMVFSVFYALWGYFASARLALTLNGAHQIKKADNPKLWRIVENLSITEGLPMPKVYIIKDKALNAFATGRNPEHASVAVTTGLVEALDDNELQGVMAHELGHIKNFDIRVSMIAFALVSVISLLCDFFLRMSFFGGGDADDDDSAKVFAILGIVAIIIAPIVATLLQLAISRKREYLADATGALSTRYPEGLASALEKIQAHGSAMHRQNTSTAHLFFASPLKGKSIAALLSTHPPIDQRIKILREMTL